MTNPIRESMEGLEQRLREFIQSVGVSEVVNRTGIKQPDISLWLHNKRKWSYEKILDVAERLKIL